VRELVSGNGGAWSSYDSVLVVVAYALLLSGLSVTLLEGHPASAVVLPLVVLVAAVRAFWLATAYGRPGSARRDHVLFAVHIVLVAALCAIEPAFGLYAWIGLIDAASLLTRWASLAGITATALLIAVSEVGGPGGVADRPLVFTSLVIVNVVIPWSLSRFMVQVQRQSEERRCMILRLECAMRENEELHEQLVERAEESGRLGERTRVAQELHDTVAQGLVGIVTQLEAAERDADWAGRGLRARELARESLVQARRAIAALSDPVLAHGLPQALDETCRQWTAITQIPVRVAAAGRERSVDCADQLLRICQESLSNAVRHAEPSEVRVALDFRPDGVTLTVADDGAGFDPGTVRWGFGVAGMRQRASDCGGTFALSSAPGAGTTVEVTVPTGHRGAGT
jgi:signal transduction histidine kinase